MTSAITEIKNSMNELKRIGEQENKSKKIHKMRQNDGKYKIFSNDGNKIENI